MVELASRPDANVAQLAREHGVDNNLILSGYASGRERANLRRMPATIVGPVVPQSLPASPDSVVRRRYQRPVARRRE